MKKLYLYGNPNLTKAEIENLQKALLNCKISHNVRKYKPLKERKYYMKKLVLFAVAAVLAMNMAEAADDKGKAGIQILLTKLDLNADQQKKLDEFNKAHQEKYDQARKLKGDARKAKLREITVARNALLDELLTGEQQAKLKELKAAKKGKKKESKDK